MRALLEQGGNGTSSSKVTGAGTSGLRPEEGRSSAQGSSFSLGIKTFLLDSTLLLCKEQQAGRVERRVPGAAEILVENLFLIWMTAW